MGDRDAVRGATLKPLSTMGFGMLLVLLDLRVDGLDLVPDPLGWLLALAAAGSLSRLHPAFPVVAVACGLGLVASGPDWVGRGGPVVAVEITVAETVVVFATCTAVMALLPERRGGANALRWWDLGLTLVLTVLLLVAAGEPDVGVLALLVGIAELVVFVCFIVLLFKAARATPPTVPETIRNLP
ncbi:hypothetical protein ACT8ZV_07575 [Nocardioides sp. MAHUQ-72]|uniref:hypothetical protein n=1 Tax=unclassified Nocardioides TaxID=2615069 RepID=UPI00361A12E9